MRIWLFLPLSLMLTHVSAENTHPNFSGNWVMNGSKSNFGQMYPPTSFVRKITHTEPAIEIFDVQTDGSSPSLRKLTTDGTVHAIDVNGTSVAASIVWEGNDLIATSLAQDFGLKFIDRISLSGDGNILTSKVIVSSALGETELTIVFDRQK